jgi:TolB-like protein
VSCGLTDVRAAPYGSALDSSPTEEQTPPVPSFSGWPMRRGNGVLVVLPFQTPGDTGDEAVIARGLLEEITGELSRFATL